ncbi:MAG: hypothetical protein U0176_05395 [Bacteroidia bacterium]
MPEINAEEVFVEQRPAQWLARFHAARGKVQDQTLNPIIHADLMDVLHHLPTKLFPFLRFFKPKKQFF